MSYGQWIINEELTFNDFNYYSTDLTNGSNKPVKCECVSCGMITNKRMRESKARHRCNPIIDGRKKCFKCNNFKLIEEFSKNRSNYDKHQKVCKESFSNYSCVKNGYSKKNLKIKNSIEHYFNSKLPLLKKKCFLKNLPFNLEKGGLLDLYNKQNGKCYYTNIEIIHNEGCSQYNSISIERLTPEKGYTKNNVVLSSFSLNSFKGMMSEIEFKQFLNEVIPKLIEYKDK